MISLLTSQRATGLIEGGLAPNVVVVLDDPLAVLDGCALGTLTGAATVEGLFWGA